MSLSPFKILSGSIRGIVLAALSLTVAQQSLAASGETAKETQFDIAETSSSTSRQQPARQPINDEDIRRLNQYLKGSAPANEQQAPKNMSTAPSLPDVDTMIERLAARLKTDASDVEGWRMLGWSYQHTSRPKEAVVAYEQAVKLAPTRKDLMTALSEARAAASQDGTASTDKN